MLTSTTERASPYQGLDHFGKDDAEYFFGREKDTRLIIANMFASSLLLLYGASGVGKTSVLQAGVMPRLKQRQDDLLVVAFDGWQNDPVKELQTAISHEVGNNVPLTDNVSLAEYLAACTAHLKRRFMIILDHFEEYFLYHFAPLEQDAFVKAFSEAVSQPDLPVHFLVSIREDALAKLDRFEGYIPNLFNNYFRIDYLDEEAAREAIIKPLEKYHADIEEELIKEVLQKVEAGQVSLGELGRGRVKSDTHSKTTTRRIDLPYLQLVMTRLWNEEKQAEPCCLRLETLNRLGGVERILQTHLDEVMNKLTLNDQSKAAQVFSYLVTPDGNKIALTGKGLEGFTGLTEAQLTPILDELTKPNKRILRVIAPSIVQRDAPRYEIFHEVLTPAILDWRNRHLQTKTETKWIGGLIVFMALLVGALVMYFLEERTVDSMKRIVQSQELAAGAMSQVVYDPELSILLAREAVRVAPTEQAEDALITTLTYSRLRRTMRGHKGSVNSAVFSPDGKWIATASVDGAARIWDAATGESVAELRGHHGAVNTAVFSPDGKFLVTASYDNTAKIWKSDTIKIWKADTIQVVTLIGHTNTVWNARFSPDGNFVVTASSDSTARVWDAQTGYMVSELRGHKDAIWNAAFSPDSKLVVTASGDQTARVWQIATGRSLIGCRGHTGVVTNARFSSDGKWIVTASFDSTARVWEAATGKMTAMLTGHRSAVFDAEFSPDNRIIVTAGTWPDNTARIWERATEKNMVTLIGHTSSVNKATFSPDGKMVITASYDNTARVWEASTGRNLAELRDHNSVVFDAAFSTDAKWVVTAGGWPDNTARIWEAITETNVLRELRGHTGVVNSLAFTSDGKWLVSTSADCTAQIWEMATGKQVDKLVGHKNSVVNAVFSPNNNWLATTSLDSTVRIWEMSSRQNVLTISHAGNVKSAAFSFNSKWIVTAGDTTAQIWEISSGRRLAELRGHRGAVLSAAFSPDAKFVVTTGNDKTARLWETSTARLVAEFLGHTDAVVGAMFSSNGKRIVTAGFDGTIQVWEIRTGRNLAEIRGLSKPATGAAFSPNGKLVATISKWPVNTVRVWEAATRVSIAELRGHTNTVRSASFSPNGKWIVTTSFDSTARIWETRTGRSVIELRDYQEVVNSAVFSPDGKFVVTASRDGIARIYACDVCGSIEDLLALTRTRVTRGLTPAERERYLYELQNK